MKVTVIKEFTFDSAHYLPEHPGKCKNLHGHSYRLQVGIAGEPDEKTGMVIDFGEIKDLVDGLLIRIDHRNLNELDLPDFPSHCPTAENMVGYFVRYFERVLYSERKSPRIELALIRLWETSSSYVEWRRKPDEADYVDHYAERAHI